MNKSIARASAALLAAGAVAAGVVTPAGADTIIYQRNINKTAKIGSGGAITIKVTGSKAKLSPGMVALPTTRNAWVSGLVQVTINGEEPSGGSIEAGYVVGCQLDISGGEIGAKGSAGAGVGYKQGDGGSYSASVSASTGASISLAAGTMGTQSLTYDRKKWPKPGDTISPSWNKPSTSFDFDGGSGSFSYTEQTIGVDGCGGYAQARLYVIATGTVGNSQGTVIAWGDAFTLG